MNWLNLELVWWWWHAFMYIIDWNQDDELWLAKMLSVLYLAWMCTLMMIWWCEFDVNWEGVIGLSGILFMISCLGYHHYMVCVHSCIHESTWCDVPHNLKLTWCDGYMFILIWCGYHMHLVMSRVTWHEICDISLH